VRKFYYTGNPFLDASLAAILAITDKDSPEAITLEDLEKALAHLKHVLLSPQALGKHGKKSFTKGALTQIFPNSPLANPSPHIKNPEEVYKNLLERTMEKIRNFQEGDKLCPVCGRNYLEGETRVRADKFPLLRGLANFYPFLSDGMEICPFCFIAIQFFPMSVLKGAGYLWFFHTQNIKLAKAVSRIFGWRHFETLIAANSSLGFYGEWESLTEAGTVLNLFYKLLKDLSEYEKEIFDSPHPVIVYLFTNDNRTAFVKHLIIPNEVLIFLGKLRYRDKEAFERFFKELLLIPSGLKGQKLKARRKYVSGAARAIIEKRSILSYALDDAEEYLRGGWKAHQLYLTEVRKMPAWKLGILERLGLKIFSSADQKKWLTRLKTASYAELGHIFSDFVQNGWLKAQELYLLSPPGEEFFLFEARDILLAILYENQHLAREGKSWPGLLEENLPDPDKYYRRIETITEGILNHHPNPERFLGDLRSVRKPQGIRGVYLKGMEHGALRWKDFIFLAPIEDMERLYLNRDYLMACLTERISQKEV